MKTQNRATRYLLLILLGTLLPACSKVSSPMSPSLPGMVAAPPPLPIYWYGAALSRVDQLGSLSNRVDLYLSVNDNPEASAQVTLEGEGSSLAIPYAEAVTIGYAVYAHYALADGSFQYQPGTSYTLTTVTSAGTATGSVKAPGGISNASNGAWSRWSSEGNQDRVFVENSGYSGTFDSFPAQADLASVFNLPAEAYPAPGTYFMRTTCRTLVTHIDNAVTGSLLVASDEFWSTFSR